MYNYVGEDIYGRCGRRVKYMYISEKTFMEDAVGVYMYISEKTFMEDAVGVYMCG